jgi:hypothetical protein
MMPSSRPGRSETPAPSDRNGQFEQGRLVMGMARSVRKAIRQAAIVSAAVSELGANTQ